MWVTKYYKNSPWGKEYYLWNRKPEKVSVSINKWLRKMGHSELEYNNRCGKIYIDKEYNTMFDGLEQPIEVELIRDESWHPMFYAQKILDSKGNENVYINTRLEYRYHKPYGGFKLFGITLRKPKKGLWYSSSFHPIENYSDLTVNVSTSSHRIRPKDFPWSVEDGVIPVTLKIKEI